MNVAVLIPCYNEAQTIGKVIRDFRAALPEAKVYVYDNNSSDGTAEEAEKMGAIVKRERRQGKGNVVRSMFRDIEADAYLMVDGDDTYPAESAAELLKLVEEGADMVIGDRLSSTYLQVNQRAFHNFGNLLVRKLVNVCFGGDIVDIMTGCRAFSRRYVKTFPSLSSGFETETEMTIHALDKRLSVESIPIEYRARPEGSVSKLNTFADGFKVLVTIVNMLKEYRPLLFFASLAGLLVLISAAMFVPVMFDYLKTGLVPRFPTLIVSGLVFTVACVLLTCGIILDIIARKSRQEFEMFLKGTSYAP